MSQMLDQAESDRQMAMAADSANSQSQGGQQSSGMSEAELLEDFPQLSHDDVLACFAYAADHERCLITLPSLAA